MKKECLNELSRLYRLKEEGCQVECEIQRLEKLIGIYCEMGKKEQLDAKKAYEKDN